jgi:hypothetical protein
MVKIIPLGEGETYSEVPQNNPQLFSILYKEGDVFHEQTGPMKCRDFLNDYLSARHGLFYSIYRFDNATIKLQDVLWLKYTKLAPNFMGNIERCLSPLLEEQLGIVLTWIKVDDETCLVEIPEQLFTTYKLSVLTWIIRCCNCDDILDNIGDLFSNEEKSPRKTELYDAFHPDLLKNWFLLPNMTHDYWWYAGGSYNSESGYIGGGIEEMIHDNGYCGWLAPIEEEEYEE